MIAGEYVPWSTQLGGEMDAPLDEPLATSPAAMTTTPEATDKIREFTTSSSLFGVNLVSSGCGRTRSGCTAHG